MHHVVGAVTCVLLMYHVIGAVTCVLLSLTVNPVFRAWIGSWLLFADGAVVFEVPVNNCCVGQCRMFKCRRGLYQPETRT
jgi:hypothetical protein